MRDSMDIIVEVPRAGICYEQRRRLEQGGENQKVCRINSSAVGWRRLFLFGRVLARRPR